MVEKVQKAEGGLPFHVMKGMITSEKTRQNPTLL